MTRTTEAINHYAGSLSLVEYPVSPVAAADGGALGVWPAGLLVREFAKLQLARLRHLAADFGS